MQPLFRFLPARTPAAATTAACASVAALRIVQQPGQTWICMRLTVASTELLSLRQALHRALGSLARAYVVTVDYRHGETALHVEVARSNRDAAMSAIMLAFPAAVFGVMTALGDDHVAH